MAPKSLYVYNVSILDASNAGSIFDVYEESFLYLFLPNDLFVADPGALSKYYSFIFCCCCQAECPSDNIRCGRAWVCEMAVGPVSTPRLDHVLLLYMERRQMDREGICQGATMFVKGWVGGRADFEKEIRLQI